MEQRRRWVSETFWICRKETRKHNRQCQPPVCWAGPRSASLCHCQLCLQNDEAVKPVMSKWQWPFCNLTSSSVCFWPGLDNVLSVSCWFVSVSLLSFFLSALLVCLDFGLFWSSLYLKALVWIQRGGRGSVVHMTTTETVRGRKFIHRLPCVRGNYELKTKGTMLSLVGEQGKTCMFQGFVLFCWLIYQR